MNHQEQIQILKKRKNITFLLFFASIAVGIATFFISSNFFDAGYSLINWVAQFFAGFIVTALASTAAFMYSRKGTTIYDAMVGDILHNEIDINLKYTESDGKLPIKYINQYLNRTSSGSHKKITKLVEGNYKGIKFKFCHLYKYTVSPNSYGPMNTTPRTKTTWFKGIWLEIDIKNAPSRDLILVEKRFKAHKVRNKKTSISTESIEFNKKFNINTMNQTEALKVLSPRYMEMIMDVEKILRGKLLLAYNGDKLIVAADTRRPLFKYDRFKGPEKSIQATTEQINKIIEVINLVNRYNKLRK